MSNNTPTLNKKKISLADNTILFSLIAIFLGLLLGAVILLVAGFNPFEAYGAMIDGIIGKPKYMAWTIIKSTPLILTGLSVAFAFKTGLFNIGAEGQFIVGSLAATIVGYSLHAPAIIHIPLTILAGALAGGLWAGIAGFLKARFGVNEVITTIMLNWIGFYLSNYMVMSPWLREGNSEGSHVIQDTAMIKISWLRELVGPATSVNWGIVISIILVLVIAFVIAKTTLGFELRAVGFNKYGAEYAGIDVKKSIIKSMVIAGILAGVAGAIQVMGVSGMITNLAAQEGNGFDGIAVALIANSNPIGVIFSGLLFGAFKYGGTKMQTIGAPSEVINIVTGSIVYFIALTSVIKMAFTKLTQKRSKGGTA